jgi:flagellin
MKDLNSEINSTAKRTSFNGINLLSSGASVDSTNSDFYAGQELVLSAVSISGTGLGSSGTLGSADVSTYTTSISDSFKKRMAGLSYTFSNAGADLTLTGTLDGQAISQTVSVQTVVGTSATAEVHSQTLDFSSLGTSIVLNTSTTTVGTLTGTTIASGFTTKATLSVTGTTGAVSDINLSNTSSGSYVLSASNGTVTMTGTINGMSTTQSLLLSTVAANSTTTFSFDSFGVSFDLSAYGTALNNSTLAATFVALNEGTQAAAGTLVLSSGQNSSLEFQSGATSEAFITVNTVNVMTGSSGTTAGAASEMKAVGTAITDTSSDSYLGGLNSTDDITTWQAAFQAAESAIDTALDYISTQRGVYGSQMNRLSYVSTNLSTQSTNLQNSRSAIIDTDFAAETAQLTKGQIMQQAATAMLAQANQMPNVVLSLLK